MKLSDNSASPTLLTRVRIVSMEPWVKHWCNIRNPTRIRLNGGTFPLRSFALPARCAMTTPTNLDQTCRILPRQQLWPLRLTASHAAARQRLGKVPIPIGSTARTSVLSTYTNFLTLPHVSPNVDFKVPPEAYVEPCDGLQSSFGSSR